MVAGALACRGGHGACAMRYAAPRSEQSACTYMYIHVHTYIYMHIHTHAYTYICTHMHALCGSPLGAERMRNPLAPPALHILPVRS